MDDMEAEATAAETPEPEAQGFKICIYGTAGGALTFAVEPGGDEEAAAAGTPVRSLQELIKMVKETVLNGGGSPEASDAEFKAGLGEGEDA
jgi:hypothetical protein